MKKIIFLTIALAVSTFARQTFAQTEASAEEKKNKVVMTIMDGGKAITAEINSVNISINRYEDNIDEEQASEVKSAVADTSNVKLPKTFSKRAPGISYLTIEAKSLSKEMMQVLAKIRNRFDGTITITDAATKKVVKSLKFKGGALYTYSDQLTSLTESYGYNSIGLSLSCKGLSIDGVDFN
ncbi:hypothetical protein FPZ42_14285 [Mucilaginibacter achroorhodeus]|uniref:Uncharacterized protein n=1 Tax=Mucilaginibacter achroorhodeus TaxID=2599294 RepID=A0A563U066_9SPHI|nr:hypothetical protein [Mucilaginibacter achroorhodeus]TWR24923.1 hypothetical protein FPZ42_14285 [Mucilaginibacter achroorhodeus]